MPDPQDPDLEARLADLALHLDATMGLDPAATDLTDAVTARLAHGAAPRPERRSRPGPLLRAAAVAVALAVAIVLAVAPARRAVAGWLGLHGTEVVVVDELPPTVADRLDLGDLGPATTLAAARQRVGFDVLTLPGLGEPDAYPGRPPGGLTQAWPDRRVVLTQHPADVDTLGKQVLEGTTAQQVVVEGSTGYWITGPDHVLDDGGDEPRRAGNTLAFAVDDTVVRLEVDGGLDDARALAATLR